MAKQKEPTKIAVRNDFNLRGVDLRKNDLVHIKPKFKKVIVIERSGQQPQEVEFVFARNCEDFIKELIQNN